MDDQVSTQITRAMVSYLEKTGVDLEQFFAGPGLSRDYLCSPQKWLGNEDLLLLFAQARELFGMQQLAYHTGRELILSRKDELIANTRASKSPLHTLQLILDWLSQIYPLARLEPNLLMENELLVKVSKAREYIHSHDHCLFIKGVLEAMIEINGCQIIESGEETCIMAIDQVGEINGRSYKIDDAGLVLEYENPANLTSSEPTPLKKIDPQQVYEIRGTRYKAEVCSYRLKWKDPRSTARKAWDQSLGALFKFVRILLALEKSPMLDSRTYEQVSSEWKLWLGWEQSYSLTKTKYLAYLGILALSALPLSGKFFDYFNNYLFQGFSGVALSILILVFGLSITRLQLNYARQLHRQKEQAERFLQQAGVGVTMLNQNYEIVFANPLVQNLYGEVTGRKCHQALRWEDQPCPDCSLQKVFREKAQIQMEVKNITRQGQEKWFYSIFTPIIDKHQQVVGALQISTDITDKKLLEFELAGKRAALEASEYKYRNFMANAADAILITDASGYLVEASNQLYQLLEIQDQETVKDTLLLENMAYDTAEKQKLSAISKAMLKERCSQEFELKLQCPSGKIVDVEVRAIPILCEEQISWMQYILRDITERKRRELEKNLMLSVSKAIKDAPNLQELLEQALKGITAIMEVPIAAVFLKNPEQPQLELAAQIGRSPQAIKRLARIAIDGSANNIASRTAILNRPIVVPNVRELKMDQETRESVDRLGVSSMICMPMVMEEKLQGVIQLATRDTRFFDLNKLHILTQMANELAVAVARQRLRDALEKSNQELRQKHQELEKTTLQLLQSEKMASIGQLAAGIAHEINNPLGFINANLNVLEDYRQDLKKIWESFDNFISRLNPQSLGREQLEELKALNRLREQTEPLALFEDFRALLKESRDGAERVKKIILNLKEFSHPSKGEPELADINAGLDSTLNIVWNELKYKAEVKKEYGQLPKVICYPQELNQVFMNLLVNAAQAIEDKGEIILKTWAQNGNVNIQVRDTGIGIPPEHLSKIFDPFFTTKEVGKGTGLGLSISYGIVKKHNGVITVESEPGKGTVFTVSLPVEGAKAEIKPEGLMTRAEGA